MLWWIVLIVLILALLGSVPAWPYSRGWGWRPGGLIGFLILILLVVWLFGLI